MNSEIPGQAPDNQDILDLGLDPKTTARFIELRIQARVLVDAASQNDEGKAKLDQVMGFLNSEIESFRGEFQNQE